MKLTKLLKEIKIVGSPEEDLKAFVSAHLEDLCTYVSQTDDLENYLDLSLPFEVIELTPMEDSEGRSYSAVEVHNPTHPDNIDIPDFVCVGILFTLMVSEKLEGDGPVNSGVIIDYNGYKIQYQCSSC